MMDFKGFSEYIKFATGRDYVAEVIQPRMKEIAKSSLSCACETISHRKNSWELYGFDFMIDDSFNTWLIEINSSPACDYSTKVTEVYVQKALVEILNVVLDLREWERQDKDTRGVKPDTGGWGCIHKGPFLDVPLASFGSDMGIKGSAMKCPPKRVPIRSYSSSDKDTKEGIETIQALASSTMERVLKEQKRLLSRSEKVKIDKRVSLPVRASIGSSGADAGGSSSKFDDSSDSDGDAEDNEDVKPPKKSGFAFLQRENCRNANNVTSKRSNPPPPANAAIPIKLFSLAL